MQQPHVTLGVKPAPGGQQRNPPLAGEMQAWGWGLGAGSRQPQGRKAAFQQQWECREQGQAAPLGTQAQLETTVDSPLGVTEADTAQGGAGAVEGILLFAALAHCCVCVKAQPPPGVPSWLSAGRGQGCSRCSSARTWTGHHGLGLPHPSLAVSQDSLDRVWSTLG